MATTTYNDISPRTAAYAAVGLLKVGSPYLVFELFGQAEKLPKGETKAISFRRYNALPLATTPLTEGVAPAGSKLTETTVTATLQQYGDFVQITDVIQDTHEDPVLQQAQERLGQQAAETIEVVRAGVLVAGTNAFFANGSARDEVNTPISLKLQRKIIGALKKQRARKITRVMRSTADYGTKAVNAGYIGVIPIECENDVREMKGFVPVEEYGQITPFDSEIGKVEDVRYLTANVLSDPEVLTGFVSAGGDAGAMKSTDGTKADVFPVLFFGADAYGLVAHKAYPAKNANGRGEAITPVQMLVSMPKPTRGDELAQVGSAGWKTYQTAVILNDAWMARAEVAVTEL